MGTRRPTLRSAGQTDLHERWTTTGTIRQGNTRRTITDERSWEVWDGFADFADRSSVTRLRHCRDSSVARGDGSDQGEQVSQCSSEDQWERDQVLQESLQLACPLRTLHMQPSYMLEEMDMRYRDTDLRQEECFAWQTDCQPWKHRPKCIY